MIKTSIFTLAFILTLTSSVAANDGDDRIISSITPSSAAAGSTVRISGNNLDATVYITDSLGQASTVTGTLNSPTNVSFRIPSELPRGEYKVKVGPNTTDVSNEVALTVTSGSGPTITSIRPTQTGRGDNVTISGTSLGAEVKLILGSNTLSAIATTNPSLTEAVFEVPMDAPSGEYTVTITSPDGTATSPTKLKVNAGGAPFVPGPRPRPPTDGLPTDFGSLVVQVFAWAMGLLGIAVFVMFFSAGFLWLTAAGNTANVGNAKSKMTNAVFGAILLLSSYLILNTINPNFIKNTFNLPGIATKSSPNNQTPPENPPNPPAPGEFLINCDSPPDATSPSPMAVMQQVKNDFPNLNLTDESPGGDKDKFTAEVAKRLNASDNKWGRKKSSSTNPISVDTLGYLRPDIGANRFEAVDILAGGSGNLQRGCFGVVSATQVWVAP